VILRTMAVLTSVILMMMHASLLWAQTYRNPWHYTAKEIEIAYRYQRDYGKGLKHPLKAANCLFRAESFRVDLFGKQQQLPCRFITETLRQLREILQAGAARYLFPLDLDHAHLAIPKSSWRAKYSRLPSGKILPAILKDPRLVALYHSAEHLMPVNPMRTTVNRAVDGWREKRNILGFYDGRPIEILEPHSNGSGVSVPNEYWSYGGIEFLASRSACLAVILKDRALGVNIGLSIGNDSAAVMLGGIAANP
jgi:hypothetical protein